MTTGDDLGLVMQAVRQHLGPVEDWPDQPGYPNSLALCIIDCIWSLGVRYDAHVGPVLDRYRALRRTAGADPSKDTASDLVDSAAEAGGAEQMATLLGNRQRTSTRNGVLKAEAIAHAARLMKDLGVETPAELVSAAERDDVVMSRWRTLPGQRSSSTGWRYLLILAGSPEVKPDRMILKFIRGVVGRAVGVDEARDLILSAATRLDIKANRLDHQIWRYQSGRITR